MLAPPFRVQAQNQQYGDAGFDYGEGGYDSNKTNVGFNDQTGQWSRSRSKASLNRKAGSGTVLRQREDGRVIVLERGARPSFKSPRRETVPGFLAFLFSEALISDLNFGPVWSLKRHWSVRIVSTFAIVKTGVAVLLGSWAELRTGRAPVPLAGSRRWPWSVVHRFSDEFCRRIRFGDEVGERARVLPGASRVARQ